MTPAEYNRLLLQIYKPSWAGQHVIRFPNLPRSTLTK